MIRLALKIITKIYKDVGAYEVYEAITQNMQNTDFAIFNYKEFLLQSIIRAYIENLEPIGSTQLKSMYDITYSPATIRGYFKKLGEEGYLAQEHISSGRTPTTEALKQYWQMKLGFKLKGINLRALEYFASEIGLCVFIKKVKTDILKDILNVENKYMILEFSSFAISVKYSDALYRFLKDMIGLDLKDITKISNDVGAYEVYEAITQNIQNTDFEIFNYKENLTLALNYDFNEYTINKFLKGQILDELTEGLYFEELLPSSYIGICNYCKINNEDVKMLVIGELPKDYEYFYEKITTF